MKTAESDREQKIADAKAQDKPLIAELAKRLARRVRPLPELQPFLSRPLSHIAEIEQLLQQQGTLEIRTTYVDFQDTDGEKYHMPILKAADTGMWPMGTNWYARDNVLIPVRLLETSKDFPELTATYTQTGKELLHSALTMFSTVSQLARFQQVIESQDENFPHQRENWPQVFLTIADNLNGSRYEGWSHKQDAWQMLAYHTLDLIERGMFSVEELKEKHKTYLASVLPFLAKIQFWKEANSGSWEELAARRTSVIAWDVKAIEKIAAFAKRPEGKFLVDHFESVKGLLPAPYASKLLSEVAEILLQEGRQALATRLPFECPDYDASDPHYREADAALIYLLCLDIPSLLSQPAAEGKILEQIERLTDSRTGGIRRYLDDSYQGKSFFRNEIVLYLTEVYGAPAGDASGADQWVNRRKVVPEGPEAGWTHFVWQMSAWAGKRYVETRDKKYLNMQQNYFTRGLRLITGSNEVSIEQTPEGSMRVFDVPAWRIPEAYLTDEGPNGEELVFPSPHTPLNWAVGEAIYALAMMKRSLKLQSN